MSNRFLMDNVAGHSEAAHEQRLEEGRGLPSIGLAISDELGYISSILTGVEANVAEIWMDLLWICYFNKHSLSAW